MMGRLKKLSMGMVLIVATCLGGSVKAQVGPQDAIKLVPADAWAYVLVRDLKAISDQVDRSAKDLELPLGGSLIEKIKTGFGVSEGLAEDGTFAFIVLDVMVYGQAGMIVAAVPTKDPKGVMEALKVQEGTDGAPATFTPPDVGMPLSVVPKGKYLLIGPDAQAVQAVASADPPAKLPAAMRPWLKKYHVFASGNLGPMLEAVQQMVMPMLAMFAMGGGGGMGGPGGGGAAADSQQLIMQTFTDVMSAALQLDQLYVGAELNDDGFQLHAAVSFKPDTTGAGFMDGKTNSTKSLLVGLPGGDYLFAAGSRSDPEVSKLVTEWSNKIQESVQKITQAAAQGRGAQPDQELLDKYKKLAGQWGELFVGQSMVVAPAPQGAKDGLFRAAWNLKTTDSKKALDLLEKLMPLIKEGSSNPMAQGFMPAIEFQRDAEKIGALSVSKLKVDFGQADAVEEKFLDFLEMAFGGDVIEARIAAVGPQWMTCTFGGGPAYFKQVTDLAKAGKAPLAEAEGIRKVGKSLMAEKSAEMYLNVGKFIELIRRLREGGNAEAAPRPAAAVLPVALAMRTGKGMGHMKLFVPVAVIKQIAKLSAGAAGGGGGPIIPPAPMPLPPAK